MDTFFTVVATACFTLLLVIFAQSIYKAFNPHKTVCLEDKSTYRPTRKIPVVVTSVDSGRFLEIKPKGYGTNDFNDSPVCLEIWENRLRVVVFKDINDDEPTIIDLESARTDRRIPDNVISIGPRITSPPFVPPASPGMI